METGAINKEKKKPTTTQQTVVICSTHFILNTWYKGNLLRQLKFKEQLSINAIMTLQ